MTKALECGGSVEQQEEKSLKKVVEVLRKCWKWSVKEGLGELHLYWEEEAAHWYRIRELLERPRPTPLLQGEEKKAWGSLWQEWTGNVFEGGVGVVDVVTQGKADALARIKRGDKKIKLLHIVGFEYLYENGEKGAVELFKWLRQGRGILLDLTGPDMTFRYRRRLIGNLVRFGVVEKTVMEEIKIAGGFRANVGYDVPLWECEKRA